MGQSNLVTLMEHDFGSVRYFALSALGRSASETGRPFESQGVMAPVSWALPVMRLEEAVS
jgi:hypothetical protein